MYKRQTLNKGAKVKKITKYWKKLKIRTQIILVYILILILSFALTSVSYTHLQYYSRCVRWKLPKYKISGITGHVRKAKQAQMMVT